VGSTVSAVDGQPATPDDGVEVRRSRRRLRTVSAYRENGRTIVLIPARFTAAQEREWVERMLARLSAQDRRRRPGDAELMSRARELSRRYLAGRADPVRVSWASNQQHRWGSCTPEDRTIRVSTRLQGMPGWVLDYVLLHELAHLLERGHGPRFWALLEGYPRTERARGYLDGFAAARELSLGDDDPDAPGNHDPDDSGCPGPDSPDCEDPDCEDPEDAGDDAPEPPGR
jgi:predicted metal-dependent hydrolase